MFTQESYANLPYWNYLPMGVTNYGGDTQVFTIPEYASGQIGLYLNPAAQAQMNQSITFPGMNNGPVINPTAVDNMTKEILYPTLNKLTSGTINTCLRNISMTKQRLNAMLQSENTKEEDKAKINELLDKLKVQEEKLKELAESTDLDPKTAYDKANEIENNIREIVNQASKIQSGTKVKSEDKEDKVDKEDDDRVDKKDKKDDETTVDNDDDEATGAGVDKNKAKVDNFSSANISLVDDFYDATYCAGTNNPKFEAVCGAITKDNVMDIMLAWNKYHSAEKGESFMQAFMDDANSGFCCAGGQKVKYGKQIARALREKAEELGIYDECRADFAAIDKEMGSWFYVNNGVAQNYDNIIKKIAAKMGSKYGSVQTTAEPKDK